MKPYTKVSKYSDTSYERETLISYCDAEKTASCYWVQSEYEYDENDNVKRVKHPKCKFKYCPNCGKKIVDEYKKHNDYMLSAEDLTRYADWNSRSQPEDQCLS